MSDATDIVSLPTRSRPRDTLGRPLHDLRISVMDRCNFRCPYCMPRQTFHDNYRFLKSTERLSFEEIARLARLFVDLGAKKLRLTGGEPLLRPNVAELVGELTPSLPLIRIRQSPTRRSTSGGRSSQRSSTSS